MTRHRDEAVEANRIAWNASAEKHRGSAEWHRQMAGFADAGFSTFDPVIGELLGRNGVSGARAVQIGCNNGREVLSLLALGAAEATGIDQSDAFIAQAEELRSVSPHRERSRFVRANAYDLPGELRGAFDFGLITIGVINWMPDLAAFFDGVAALLAPGGRLAIYETHPVLEMLDPHADDPFRLRTSYFRTEPFVGDEEIIYDGTATGKASPSFWYVHTMGEIVTGCIRAGLQVTELVEYPHSNREVDYDIYADQEAQLPLCYTLTACKP